MKEKIPPPGEKKLVADWEALMRTYIRPENDTSPPGPDKIHGTDSFRPQ